MASAFCKLRTSYEPPLLALPEEILLIIARFVVEFDSVDGERYEQAFLKRSRYSCLLSLSCVHRILRRVCITAGLFRYISPKSMNFNIVRKFQKLQPLVSLSVDLGKSKVWPICAQLMEQFPDLDELQLFGSPAQGMSLFDGSNLSRRFSLFKGSSLVLRSAYFTHNSLPVLKAIRRDTVISLYFDKSKLHLGNSYSINNRSPMFSNLKRVKFIGVPVTSDQYRVDTFDFFVDLFLAGCQLTHFEISYGFEPFCSGKSVDDALFYARVRKMINANLAYITVRRKILLALRRSSYASLKIFVHHDRIGEKFIADDTLSQRHENILLSPFRKMKLLVFRIKDIALICQEYPPNDEDCDSISAVSGSRYRLFARHHHSVWLHVCSP